MVQEILYSMLGPWSREVLPWMVSHPAVIACIFLIWMAFLAAGKYQLRRIENFMSIWVLERARVAEKDHHKVDADELYQQALDVLNQEIRHLAWFIPNKTEMYPVRASVTSVQKKINFSPDWVRQILLQNQLLCD